MSAVFADTSFYLALLRADDPAHASALVQSRGNREIVTTEFILVELAMPVPALRIMPTFSPSWKECARVHGWPLCHCPRTFSIAACD